jgi:hypothetical protein
MFDLIIWIAGLITFVVLFAMLGLLIIYGAYHILHQDSHGHIAHIDHGDDPHTQPLLGVVAPKKQEDIYGPIPPNTKRK